MSSTEMQFISESEIRNKNLTMDTPWRDNHIVVMQDGEIQLVFQMDDKTEVEVTFDNESTWHMLPNLQDEDKEFEKDLLNRVNIPVRKGDKVNFRAKKDIELVIARFNPVD